MDTKVATTLIIVVLAGGVFRYGGAYLIYTPQLNELKSSQYKTEALYNSISEQFNELKNECEILSEQNENLETQISTIEKDLIERARVWATSVAV